MILRKISKFPSIQNYATTADISDNICLYITSCAPLFISKKNTAAKNLPFCRTTAVDRGEFP